jgi:hypothetical protein
MLNCAPDPGNWMNYIIAGIILLTFKEISSPGEIILTELMAAFPACLEAVDLKQLGRLALTLHDLVPLEPIERDQGKPYEREFKFFRTAS